MADQTWNNGAGGNWGSAANWIGGIPNSTAADATIALSGAYTVNLAAGTADAVDSVVFNNASASFEQTGTLTLGGTLASFTFDGDRFILGAAGLVSGGVLDIDSGTLLDAGGKVQTQQFVLGTSGTLALGGKSLTLAGTSVLNGNIYGAGTLDITGAATIGSPIYLESKATLLVAGSVTESGPYDELYLGNGAADAAVLDILSTGTYSLGVSSAYTGYNAGITNESASTVFNAGLFINSDANGSGAADYISAVFNNTGTLESNAGAPLELEGGGNIAGKLAGAGEIDFFGGNFTLSPTIALGVATIGVFGGVSVTLGGNLNDTHSFYETDGADIALNGHNLTLASPILGSGAGVFGPGTISVTGTTSLSYGFYLNSGVTMVVAGTLNEAAANGIATFIDVGQSAGSTAALLINAGAVDNLITSVNGSNTGIGVGGFGTVRNAGLIDSSFSGTGTANFIDAYLVNRGTLDSALGELQMGGGGSLGGTLNGAGEIDFTGGSFSLSPTIAISVVTLGFESGSTVQLGANLALSDNAAFNAGSLALNGHALTLSGNDLLNGTFLGTGGAAVSDLIITGTATSAGQNIENNATLVDSGTFILNANGGFDLELGNYSGITTDSSSLTIASAGVFNMAGSPRNTLYADAITQFDGAGSVVNAGLLEATGYAGADIYPYLVNTGTLLVTAGDDLALEHGGRIGGTLTGAGEIDLAGGSFTLAPTGAVSIGTLGFDNGAVVTIGGNLNLAATAVTDNAATIALAGHNFTLASALLEGAGAVYGPATLALTGLATNTGFNILGGAEIEVAGTLVQNAPNGFNTGFYISSGGADTGILKIDGGGVYDLQGTAQNGSDINDNGGGGSVINAGLIDSQYAGLNGSANAFIVTVNSTGTLESDSGAFQLDAGGTLGGLLTGAGEIDLNGGYFSLLPNLSITVATLGIESGAVAALRDNLTLTGSVSDSGGDIALNGNNLVLTNPNLQAYGSISGPGIVTLLGTSTLDGFYFTGGATLVVAGTLDQTDAYYSFLILGANSGDSASVVINAGATVNLSATYLGADIVNNGTATLTNAGLLTSSNNDGHNNGDVNYIGAVVNSTGTLEANLGQLQLEDGGTLGGKLTGAGEIDLNGGVFNLAPGISITVAQLGIDSEVIAGGNLAYAGAFDLGPSGMLYLNGAAVTLSGTAALNGNVEASGDLKITGQAVAGGLYVSGGAVLEDASTITQTGYLQLGNGDSGTLAIDKGAVYNLQNQAGNAEDINESGNGTILNAGLFELTGYNNGIDAQVYAGLQNTGTITDFGAGMLHFDNGIDNDGLITLGSTDYPIGAAAADFEGSITADAGKTGTIALGANAVLYAAGTVTNQNILFTTAGTLGSDLQIGDLAAFSGTVAGFAGGDVIDIEQLQANGFTYANNILTLTEAQNGGTAALVGTLALQNVTGTIALDADGNGGTNILLNEPAATYSNPKAQITTSTWNVASGSWSTAANWTPTGVPGANTDAQIAANSGTITISYATNSTLYELSNNDNNAKFSLTGGKLMLEAGGGSYGEVVISAANFDALTGFNFYGLASLASNGTLEADTGGMNFYGGAVLAGTIAGDGRLDGSLYFTSGNVLLNAGLTVQAGGANLDFDGAAVTLGANQTLAAPVEISSSSFDFAGHTLVLGGASVLGESYYFTGLSGPGTLDITGTAALGAISLYGGANLADAGLILQNNQLYVGNAVTDTSAILISAGGTYALEDDAAAFGISEDGIGSLKNAGLLELTGYGNDTDVIALPVLNTGTILAAEGDLQLVGGGMLGGKLAGAGEIDLTVNTFGLSPGLAVSVATFGLLDDGSLNLNGTSLAISGHAELGNNTSNAENINGAGTLDITGTANAEELFLEGNKTTLEVAGTVNQLGASALGLDYRSPSTDTSALVIDHGGTYNMVGSGEQILWGGGSQSVVNNGLLETSGVFASGQTDEILAPFINTGTVLVNTGDLQFSDGGTLGGTLAGGGELDLTGGNFLLTSLSASVATLNATGANITLGSNLSINSAFIDNNGTIDVNGHNLTLANDLSPFASPIEGPGTLFVLNTISNVDLNYGFDIGAGATVLETFGSAVLFADFQGQGLNGSGTLISAGTVAIADYGLNEAPAWEWLIGGGATWKNTGAVLGNGVMDFGYTSGDTGTFINAASGVYDFTGDDAGIYQWQAGSYTFANAGLLEKTGGTSISGIQVAVNNTGTILATSGVLQLYGGGVLGGTIGGGGGEVQLASGFDLVGSEAVTFASGAYLADFQGQGLYGTGTLISAGTVAIADYGLNEAPAWEWLIGGGATWKNTGTVLDNGVMDFGYTNGDTGTFINAASGVYGFTSDDAGIYQNAGGNYTFTNNGVLEKTGGTSVSGIQAAVNNTGTILATSGVLQLYGGGVLGGTIGGGAGEVFLSSDFSLAGTETVTFASGAYFYGLQYDELSGSGTLVSAGTVSIGDYGDNEASAWELSIGEGASWKNTGVVYDTGVMDFGLVSNDTGTFINAASSVYDFNSEDAGIYQNTGGNYTFTNNGLLEKTGGTDINEPQVVINNTGTILATTGVLELGYGGSLGGTYGGGGGTVALVNGYSIAKGVTETATFASGGQFGLASNNAQMYLSGPGTFASAGTLTIADLGYSGVSGNWALNIGAGLSWKNTGTVNDFGEVILGETYGDTVTLSNTGTFNLAGSDASLLQYGGPNPQPYNFTNAGLLENSGTTGASGAVLINAVEATLTNTGTILATTGALELPYLINAGTVLAAAGAMIVIGGESPGNAFGAGLGNFSGSALGGTFGGAGTIALVGTYQLTAGKTESATFGGNVAFGFNTPATQAYLSGPGTFASAGTLAIADLGTPGNSSFPGLNLGDGAVWHNTGTVTEYGALILGENYNDKGSISNAGTWNLAGDDASLTQYGGGPNAGIFTFTNTGLLEKTGGPGLFGATQPGMFQATLANTGTVLVAGGELDVDFVANNVNGTLTGGTWESTNGLLELAGAISTDAANIILSGASASIETVNAPTPIEASLQNIAAEGTLQILGGRGFAAENPLTDAGTIILGGGELADAVSMVNTTEFGLSINAGGLIEGFGEIAFVAQNNGEILANAAGQALDVVFSTFLSATGTGTLGIAANSSLELGGIVGTGQTIAFGGTHALLAEEPGVVLSGTLAGLAPGDTIDIATTTVSAATLSGDNLFITLSGGTVLDQALSAPITGERFEITSDGSTGSDLVLYREAADTITPSPVGFGNHHVGDTVAVGLTLADTQPADGYSEALDASFSSHLGSITAAGTLTALAAGATATALSIGLLTATAGSISGDAVVTLASDGAGTDGLAPASLGTQTIGVTGAVYAYAGPTLGASTLALVQVHTNVSDDVVVTLANAAANPAYTEALDARFSGTSGAALATGTVTQLAAGGNNSNNLIAGLTTSTAGSFAGAVTLALTSDGTALDGLGLTTLAAQTIALSGSVFNLATASPEPGTISLGEHHTGASADVYLTLGNAAAPGAYSEKLDASFSGSSLATGSFSTGGSLKSLAAGTTSVVTLELKAGTGAAGAIAGEAFVTLTSDGTGVDTLGLTGLGIDSLAVTGAVYNLATAALAATTISLGEHHAGLLSSASISLQNSAAPGAYSEGLDAKFTGTSLTSGSFTTGGTIVALAAGSSSTALSVTLSGAGGSIAGTATLGLTSDGTGIDTLGLTALSAQTLAVSGTLFNEATAALSPATLALGDFHTGAAATGTLTLTNTAAKGIYSEALDANFSGSSLTHGSFSASGAISELAAGATGSLAVTLATGAAGSIAGTATLALTSDGTGIDTLGLTGLTAQVETITGAVFAYAAPTLASTIINFGIVHTGSTLAQDLVLSNGTASPYMENLDASFSGTSSGFISAGNVSELKAGDANGTGLALGIASTDTAGIISGTATLALTSDGAGIDTLGTTSLGTQIITLAGTIDNYATAALEDISGAGTLTGSGGNYFLYLGNVQQGQGSLVADIGVLNAATGVADQLGGSFVIANAGGFTDTGFATFSGIAAGQADRAPSITLSSANAGAFSELITLTPVGGNASGYASAEPNITLDVTGNVLHTYTLTTGADTIAGAGNDLIVANSGQLSTGDIINAGTGTNILTLSGDGVFDMRAPATLTGITTVEAQENIGTAAQTLYLDAGFTGTVNAASGPAGSSLVVYGNLDSATINVGSGNDTIYVGSSLETINAGGGNDVFYLANADAGATLNGGSGSNTLVVAGGGSFAMGTNISSISNVVINEMPTQFETFVANSSAGLAILGGAGNDTITLGAATQSVVTGSGNTVIYATAAQAGAAITNEGNVTLNLTTGGNATLNVNDDFLTVSLSGATNLTLSALPFITVIGSAGNDTITAMAMDQTLTGGPGIDTLIGYAGFGDMFQDTASGLNTDTIKYFGGNDLIDITNLARAGATLGYIGNATNGTLTVSNGAISAHLTLSAGSNLAQSLFHMTSDGHGGTYIALI